ncbi:transposase [Sinorhizobium medicae]|nr:transposase [Sinorhizobium medicae]
MAKVEILTGAERQRRWSTELKLSILQEAFGADGSVSDVARRHDVLPLQIYAWRKKFSPANWNLQRPHRSSRFRLSDRRRTPAMVPRGAVSGRGAKTLKSS